MPSRRADPPYPRFWAGTRKEWRAWLEANAGEAVGVWLVTSKKNSGEPHLPYADAAEEALAFGWIDSLPRKLDEKRSMLLVTPRKKGSSWSAVNKERVERLLAKGLVSEAGLAKIAAAKRDGSWDRLNEVDALILPPDLERALSENPTAFLH